MRINRRGYMLVEIILATAIAFGIAYFMLNMTIKLKNKNDDLLVETLTATDQAIIANSIMNSLKGSNCGTVANSLKVEGKKVSIDGKLIDAVNEYVTTIGPVNCSKTDNSNEGGNIEVIHINIPIEVKQVKDRNFNIKLDWILE